MRKIQENSGKLEEISLVHKHTKECPKTYEELIYYEDILEDTKSMIKKVKRVRTFH